MLTGLWKYLGMRITYQNYINEEFKSRLNVGNIAAFFVFLSPNQMCRD